MMAIEFLITLEFRGDPFFIVIKILIAAEILLFLGFWWRTITTILGFQLICQSQLFSSHYVMLFWMPRTSIELKTSYALWSSHIWKLEVPNRRVFFVSILQTKGKGVYACLIWLAIANVIKHNHFSRRIFESAIFHQAIAWSHMDQLRHHCQSKNHQNLEC